MKEKLAGLLNNSLTACFEKKFLRQCDLPSIEIDYPKESAHGDYASNIAMLLASVQKQNPRKIAQTIVENIDDPEKIIENIEIAGPGFINFFINEAVWASLLKDVDERDDNYGSFNTGNGRRIQVEFVSANPTGPLHIGHARGAVVGDVIANILEKTGYKVSREYYVNDAGNQMNLLGESVFLRYMEIAGNNVVFPDNCYQGDYIRDLAHRLFKEHGDKFLSEDRKETVSFFTAYAANIILDGIKDDLKVFGVVFDCYFSEKELHKDNGVAKLLNDLQKNNYIYEKKGARWFNTTDFGDEKDRVVIRENGEPTYFAADIAYHKNKFERGFDTVIDIWGADHHGYIPRMEAAVQALGRKKEDLHVILVQLVNLLRNGEPVAMSTRAGEFVTLKEVIDEVGKDAARYNFLMRRSNSHLDFDLELAKKQSNENPVYYVQYAHARISSIMRTAEERGYTVPSFQDINLNLLNLPEECELIKTIDKFPELIAGSAVSLEPHRLTFYAHDLAALFHSYYNKHRVVSDDRELTMAKLFLIKCIRTVLRNTLNLLGVSAPERM